MLQHAERSNAFHTWALRVLGVFLLCIAYTLMFSPVQYVGNLLIWIPLLGPLFSGVVNLGVGVASVVLALAVSCVAIGTAWLYYRPVVACTLFAMVSLHTVLRQVYRTSALAPGLSSLLELP
mmetsp:Transcript_9038/g.33245  ORF Transcript_9038/g.33245 Transcript_9038/m.33245 type:complete len:122 (-) Transcript_9038:66-431(-)